MEEKKHCTLSFGNCKILMGKVKMSLSKRTNLNSMLSYSAVIKISLRINSSMALCSLYIDIWSFPLLYKSYLELLNSFLDSIYSHWNNYSSWELNLYSIDWQFDNMFQRYSIIQFWVLRAVEGSMGSLIYI